VLSVVVFIYCYYCCIQYGIVVKKKTDVYICLMQPDKRLSWESSYDVNIGYAVLRSEGVCASFADSMNLFCFVVLLLFVMCSQFVYMLLLSCCVVVVVLSLFFCCCSVLFCVVIVLLLFFCCCCIAGVVLLLSSSKREVTDLFYQRESRKYKQTKEMYFSQKLTTELMRSRVPLFMDLRTSVKLTLQKRSPQYPTFVVVLLLLLVELCCDVGCVVVVGLCVDLLSSLQIVS